MSKAVKKVGRAIGKVVKGVVNVVKKIAKSPIGKILLVAATVYFGGAALMGAMKGAAAGSGFMGTLSSAVSGAGSGIANAWTSLTGAASSALGGNFAQAGSQLSAGIQGTTVAAPANLVASGTSLSGAPAAGGAGTSSVTSSSLLNAPPVDYSLAAGGSGSGNLTAGGINLAPNLGTSITPTLIPPPPPSPGLISGAWNSLGPYGKMAAVTGGMQMAGGYLQGAGAEKAAREERARYNSNMGGRVWSGSSGGSNYEPTTGEDGRYQSPSREPLKAPELALLRRRGLINDYVDPNPVYNPLNYNF